MVFEKATRLFVLVGLTTTKLSAWLPAVALTFTTGATQASGIEQIGGNGHGSWALCICVCRRAHICSGSPALAGRAGLMWQA